MVSPDRHDIAEITEGSTRLLVPRGALNDAAPPRDVAFYNPRASTNRDVSVAAYAAFLDGFRGPKTILEPLCGVGAGGLRAVNETGAVHHAHLNDINPNSVKLATESARLNRIDDRVDVSNDEACRFLSRHAARESRGAIVDIDPFGSPAPFFDCAVRATMHGGMISCTATDLQVLNGLFDGACHNRYGGVPVRGTTYGSETAVRIVLGCLRTVAARLGVSITPVFVSSHMHYYRAYAKITVGHVPDMGGEIGYAVHCNACGARRLTPHAPEPKCAKCGADSQAAGPLWIGRIFDGPFVERVRERIARLGSLGEAARRHMERASAESAVDAGLFYTVDEMASRAGASPPKMARVIDGLRDAGFAAAPTSFAPTGFRTDAPLDAIMSMFI